MITVQTASRPPANRAAQLMDEAVRLHQAGQHEQAADRYVASLSINPDHALCWSNYGALLRKLERYDAAVAANRRALELNPEDRSALNNLANALSNTGDFEAALAYRRKLIEAEPDNRLRERDLCAALRGLNRHQEVIERINRAEQEGRADGECRLQRALSHLMLGDYHRGFADFEHRYAGDEVSLPKNAPWPRWAGESLQGKRILVLPEQGFGDAILAARWLPGLKALGAEVHVQVKKPLERLLSRLEGVDRVVRSAQLEDRYDYYTPNMSLPHLVGVPGNHPPPPPRLHIPDDSRQRARPITAPFRNRLRVGIVWTGSLSYRSNNRRSTRIEHFLPLAERAGVQLFSLYKGPCDIDLLRSGLAGHVIDACSKDRDFADSAAVIDEMDLMITTDTAVVHVAASLGKPIWNLLSHESFWLYGLGETTPWYPSMRLFRQPAQGAWEPLFERVGQSLDELIAARHAGQEAA